MKNKSIKYRLKWAWSLALMESRESGDWNLWQKIKYFPINVVYYFKTYNK